MKVGLFIPCFIDQLYPQVGIATLTLLEKLGIEVAFPMKQTCCGQASANSGFANCNTQLEANFNQVFAPFDYVVAPSASCIYHVKYHVDDKRSSTKYYELCEFLTDVLGIDKLEAHFPHKVGLHSSCHGLRFLRLEKSSERQDPPFSKIQRLLNQVNGLELILPANSDECCGFGGSFSIMESAVSVKMGKDKIKSLEHAGVAYITSTDMSCLMHLEAVLKKQNASLKVIHISEILNTRLVRK